MGDTVKEWLKQLYENEINEAKENLNNEKIWKSGYLEEEHSMREENIKCIEEYISVLADKLLDLIKEEM